MRRARRGQTQATTSRLNDGHGTKHLSVVFALLLMLAFWVDQTPQLCCALFQAVWSTLGSKRLLWERMRALFDD